MPDNEELEGQEAGIAVSTRDSLIDLSEKSCFFFLIS